MDTGAAAAATAAAAYPPPPPLPSQAHLSAAFHQAAAAAAAAGGANPNSPAMSGNVSQFQEALMSRMGRPFGLSGGDLKDLAAANPFAAASLGLAARAAATPTTSAPGATADTAGFPGLPFLSHMAAAAGAQPHFGLHHFGLDPRHPFAAAAGAFRPFLAAASAAASTGSPTITTTSETSPGGGISKGFHSAFQPPKLDRKGSSPTLFSPGQNLFPRSSSAGSPSSPSSSPPSSTHLSHPPTSFHPHHLRMPGKADENSNTNTASIAAHNRHGSLSPASMDSNNAADGDERGGKKLRLSSASSAEFGCCCPICLMPLRPGELESHLLQELDSLAKLSSAANVSSKQQMFRPHPAQHPQHPHMMDPAFAAAAAAAGMHHQKQISPRGGMVEVAPRSRWDTFQRIQRNRQGRIRVKLSRRAAKRQDEILEEEEEPPSPKRHQRHPLSALHQQQQQQQGDQNKEEDIDIVGDGKSESKANTSSSTTDSEVQNHVYGPPQFTEADVLACMDKHKDEEDEKMEEDTKENGIKKEVEEEEEKKEEGEEESKKSPESVEKLKAKLKAVEEENNKCSKCLKTLTSPVVNVACWHIQCEKCWLLSLGKKKSCSLCGMKSSPSDLRRVFL